MDRRKRLDELLSSVPPASRWKLDEEVDFEHRNATGQIVPRHLGKIADSMTGWEGVVADYLGLSASERKDIRVEYPFQAQLQRRAALTKWKSGQGKRSTYRALINVFIEAGELAYAELICSLFKEDEAESVGNLKEVADTSTNTGCRHIGFSPSMGPELLAQWLLQEYGADYNEDVEKLKQAKINGKGLLNKLPTIFESLDLSMGFKMDIEEKVKELKGADSSTTVVSQSSTGSLSKPKGEASNIKVAVRVRPMNHREKEANEECVVEMEKNQTILKPVRGNKEKTFTFDHCFWSVNPTKPDQVAVFEVLGKDILDSSFEGYNACIFAYGQTGSGKSYTMMGSLDDEQMKGIIPRLCDTLFERIKKSKGYQFSFKVEVSYLEIYLEKVRDLLSPTGIKKALKIRESKTIGPYVENLSKLAVASFKDVYGLMSMGNKSRTVVATEMNANSSRSHAIFSIVLTKMTPDSATQDTSERVSKISVVDLAGSEISSTSSEEALKINKSLSTIGSVISTLADIASGKKGRGSFVPYRDSVLTWLLKDSLGGNSKTLMVANISPASCSYRDTLTTLRYADRAKRIINHAVVNEDFNTRIIQELKEAVEKLKAMKGGTSMIKEGRSEAIHKIYQITEQTRALEDFVKEMAKSWEEKLLESERVQQERQKALEAMGISVQSGGIAVHNDKFYLVNLNADSSMNEMLVYHLKDVTRIGRSNTEPAQDIKLGGLGIATEHCIIEIKDKDIYITPIDGARTLINGESVTEKTQVHHGTRILLGNHHLFRLNCPRPAGETTDQDKHVDYEQAMNEISLKEFNKDPMYLKMLQNLMEKLESEKEAQRIEHEEQLAKLKQELQSSITTPNPSHPKYKITTLEEEWEHKNRERLIQSVLQANRLVQEANMLADELHKDTMFRVTLTVPKSFLSPRQRIQSEETLEEKVPTMREMYERVEEGGPLLDESLGPDPFYDLEQHALLGVANFFLECLHHGIRHEYSAPIVAPTGRECGRLKVTIERAPASTPVVEVDLMDEVDISQVYTTVDDTTESDLEAGKKLACKVTIVEAAGVPREYSHYIFCQYQFWGQSEPIIIPPLVQPGPDQLPDRVQKFDHSEVFIVDVTEELLEFIDNGALSVEVWGHRRSGFMEMQNPATGADDSDVKKAKILPEQWGELTQQLELSVEMMELNDQGEYIPVEIQAKPDVSCGGIFMIRQGQSRRINICVCPVRGSGSSPLRLDHISSMSVGSIYLRNRYDEPLDSSQPHDLERLRKKWSDALMNRRDFFDTEVRKIVDKKEPTVVDLERQNELLDQWAMLQWQRAAVLNPKAGSGVPGSPTHWQLPAGFETKVSVLFLDLNDDLLTPCDDDPEGAVATGQLLGEKPETMINLPIVAREEHIAAPRATASWDSTVHNNTSLNKITENNERVYAILKVGVVLAHPPNIELVLRKRICLRVYKKMGFGAALMRAFGSKDTRTACGVRFEVVMGIPKFEGIRPPPKIPANPSFVELDEDENAVEKFKKAMDNISSILSLDRLKQEVALKEKLTTSGRIVRKRITVGEATHQEAEPVANSTHQSPVSGDVAGESTEDQPITAKYASEEESTAGVTSLIGTPVTVSSTEDKELESQKLVAIPEAEEALEVGTEMGKPNAKLQVILEEGSGVTITNPRPPPLPCTVGEKVMVETANAFKIGVIKFIGETEFATGKWIGVALERPDGKHNGTVKGVKYFRCKDKHGIFVNPDKIIHEPSGAMVSSASATSLTSSASTKSLLNKTPTLPSELFSSNPYSESGWGSNSSRDSS